MKLTQNDMHELAMLLWAMSRDTMDNADSLDGMARVQEYWAAAGIARAANLVMTFTEKKHKEQEDTHKEGL